MRRSKLALSQHRFTRESKQPGCEPSFCWQAITGTDFNKADCGLQILRPLHEFKSEIHNPQSAILKGPSQKVRRTERGGPLQMYPEEYRYSKDHEWILDQGGIGTIGITDYAQKELGDVVYVDLPEMGGTFEANEPFGQGESVKAVSDIFCPVSAEVVEINMKLEDDPARRGPEFVLPGPGGRKGRPLPSIRAIPLGAQQRFSRVGGVLKKVVLPVHEP